MKKEDFNLLVIHYDALKAHDAMVWFRDKHSLKFKNSIIDQYQYCVDNECFWLIKQ